MRTERYQVLLTFLAFANGWLDRVEEMTQTALSFERLLSKQLTCNATHFIEMVANERMFCGSWRRSYGLLPLYLLSQSSPLGKSE